MRIIFQKDNPISEQGASFAWVTALTQQKKYQRGNFNHQHIYKTRDVFGSRSRKWGIFL
jgi:hypothetical protein